MSRDGYEDPMAWVGGIFSPVRLPKPDTGIFGYGFEFQIASADDPSDARNQSNKKYILGNQTH
jgi:hypothetical protein